MPHLIQEFTDNLADRINHKSLFADFHSALVQKGGVDRKNCKSRAVKLDTFYSEKETFVHLCVALLEGRDEDVLNRIGKALLDVLRRYYFADGEQDKVDITVEIREMNSKLYFKHTGTRIR